MSSDEGECVPEKPFQLLELLLVNSADLRRRFPEYLHRYLTRPTCFAHFRKRRTAFEFWLLDKSWRRGPDSDGIVTYLEDVHHSPEGFVSYLLELDELSPSLRSQIEMTMNAIRVAVCVDREAVFAEYYDRVLREANWPGGPRGPLITVDVESALSCHRCYWELAPRYASYQSTLLTNVIFQKRWPLGRDEPAFERTLVLFPDSLGEASLTNLQATIERHRDLGLAVYVAWEDEIRQHVGEARLDLPRKQDGLVRDVCFIGGAGVADYGQFFTGDARAWSEFYPREHERCSVYARYLSIVRSVRAPCTDPHATIGSIRRRLGASRSQT
jgi:hypothetical protein